MYNRNYQLMLIEYLYLLLNFIFLFYRCGLRDMSLDFTKDICYIDGINLCLRLISINE